ncbi:hypothetical protein ACOSQ3_006929 [Xanthoceras sorbifolium]
MGEKITEPSSPSQRDCLLSFVVARSSPRERISTGSDQLQSSLPLPNSLCPSRASSRLLQFFRVSLFFFFAFDFIFLVLCLVFDQIKVMDLRFPVFIDLIKFNSLVGFCLDYRL